MDCDEEKKYQIWPGIEPRISNTRNQHANHRFNKEYKKAYDKNKQTNAIIELLLL